MGKQTAIAWTDHTFNPWWGCTKVSPGCETCYAESWAARFGGDYWGPGKPRREFGDAHWREPMKWNAAAKQLASALDHRPRVFCGSMCDVFDADAPAGALARLWDLIRATPRLDWLLLTKRPERIAASLPAGWGEGWPNVWLGVSVEDQQRGDKRMPILAATPAAVRFISCEPLLGPVNLRVVRADDSNRGLPSLHWVIAGGESGGGARPMDVEWVRSLKRQCEAARVSFFAKQLGGHPDKRDALEDFPADLQIREWPTPACKPSHGDGAL